MKRLIIGTAVALGLSTALGAAVLTEYSAANHEEHGACLYGASTTGGMPAAGGCNFGTLQQNGSAISLGGALTTGGALTIANLTTTNQLVYVSSSGNLAGLTTILAAQFPALTGDITTSAGSLATTLASVATAGTTGSSTAIPVVTIDVKGRTTGITTAAVVAPAGTLSGATLASGVTASSLTSFGTITSFSTNTLNFPSAGVQPATMGAWNSGGTSLAHLGGSVDTRFLTNSGGAINLTILDNGNVSTRGTFTIGTVNTATGLFMCETAGLVSSGVTTCVASDKSVKHDISPITDPNLIDKVLAQRGVRFVYNQGRGAPGRRIGVIANDWEANFPELVDVDAAGIRHFDYAATWGLTVEMFRQQQQEIADMRSELNRLKIGK